MNVRRTVASALVALAVLAVPAVAGAQQTEADALTCWIRQPMAPAPGAATIWRTRPDGVIEALMGSGRAELLGGDSPLCTEVLPGVLVYTPDAPAAAAWLAETSRSLRHVVVMGDEEVPEALDLYAWQRIANCETNNHWHGADRAGLHYGGLQFLTSTWIAHGGLEFAPRADLASVADQIEVGRRTATRSGFSQWACR